MDKARGVQDRWMTGLLLLVLACCAKAQSAAPMIPQAPPLQSADPLPTPTSSYASLVQSVDDVRNDMANWSAVEQAAYAESVKIAAPECLRLQQTAYDGEELLALTRLCALAQNWPSTYSAARRYTQDPTAAHRVDGYGLLLQADLHLQHNQDALDHLRELRGDGPVSAAQDELFLYVIRTMQITQPSLAIAVALQRQPDLQQCMVGCAGGLSPMQAEMEAWQTLTLVRESGFTKVQDAMVEIAAKAAERPVPLPPVQAAQVGLARRQFDSLGQPMPADATIPRGCAPTRKPCMRLYVVAAATSPIVPLLMQAMEELNGRLAPGSTAYLLLAGCVAPPKLLAPHTLCRKPPLLSELGGTALPLLVLTDAENAIRWNGAIAPAWLTAGGAAEILAARVATMPNTAVPGS